MNIVIRQPESVSRSSSKYLQKIVPNLPNGLPQGLSYLTPLNEIRIHSRFETFQAKKSIWKCNKYRICNSVEREFMSAVEESACLARLVCGGSRSFTMQILDKLNNQVCIQLVRPYSPRCCEKLEINSPPGDMIGYVKSNLCCSNPRYNVYDNNGILIFTIIGNYSYCKCCVDIIFDIFDAENEELQPIGHITNLWTGLKHAFMRENNFSLKIPASTDLIKKTILLGTVFLIDFNHFERRLII